MRLLVLDAQAERSRGFVAALRGCGYTPDQLDTLGDATEALALTPYTGMLLRRSFPDGDGVAWLRQCRERGVPIPAVVMSAGSVEERVEALNAGADDCLQTPVDARELVARVRAVLRRPHALEPALLRAGNLTMDQLSREVWVEAQPFALPRLEMCLLEHLMRRFGRVVPRDLLESNVYGHADDWCPNSLEVRVSRVRRRLAAAGASITIQAVRGVGYLLQPA
jgi:DNA-binding response OmpR family regulator